MITMVKQNQIIKPVLKGSYCIIATIICIFCLLSIITPISATDITTTNSITHTLSTGFVSSGSIGGYSLSTLVVNFSEVYRPTITVLEMHQPLNQPTISGIFVASIGGNVIASGNYYGYNGTFAGGHTSQFYLEYTTWNSYSYTGSQTATVTYSPALAGEWGYASIPAATGWSSSSGGLPYPPIAFGAWTNFADSYIITNDNFFSSATITATDKDNIGNIPINVTVNKNNYQSQTKIFSGNNLVYAEYGGINKNPVSTLVLYRPLVFQSIFTGGFAVNSSEYFTPINQYTTRWSPLSPVVNQTITLAISNNTGELSGVNLNILDYINLIDTSTDNPQIYSQYGGSYGYTYDKKPNGTWFVDYIDGSQYNLGTNIGNLQSFVLQTKGTHNLKLALEDNNKVTYYADLNITVLGSETDLNLIIYPYDQITGDSISGAQYDILDPLTNTWHNETSYGISFAKNGIEHNRYYNGVVKANGYMDKLFSFYTGFTNGILDSTVGNINYQLPMYPIINNIGVGNVSLGVEVWNKNTIALIGSSVSLISSSTGKSYGTAITGLNGAAQFVVPMNDTYKATASFSGYQTGTATIVVTTVSPVTLRIYLSPVVVTPTITIVYPTNIPTVTPTPLANGVTCNPNYWATDGNIMNISGSLQNYVACQGVKSDQNQKAVVGILITLVLLSLGAKYGGKIGAVIATSAGYIIGILMGLFPIWTLILFCAIMGVVFAAKLLTAGSSK
jgi:hypothetical protein